MLAPMPDPISSPPAAAPGEAARCASCSREIAAGDGSRCAICRRAVHVTCLRPYGHHMLACEECRLEAW
jgi:hypothetical protein